MLREIKRRFLIAYSLMVLLLPVVHATGTDQGDEQRRFLEVRRRQIDLQAARKQLDRSEKLASQGLVPQTEVERERNNVSLAQLNYQQAVLALLDLQPRISVKSAVKTRTVEGRQFVRLVIANLTPTFDDSQFRLLSDFEGADPIPESLRSRSVSDIFVALRDSGAFSNESGAVGVGAGATISLPYEAHIPRLSYGENRTLNFQLLRDVDAVTVALTYKNQTQEIPIQLQYASTNGEIQISSPQSSLEADLGSSATYELSFERPSVDVRSFRLSVANVPREISYSFIDLESQSRLSQIDFSPGVIRKSLGLKLFLPERAGDQVIIDRPIEFLALALDEASGSKAPLNALSHLETSGSGVIRLAIIPRGVGRIETVAPSLFSEIDRGQAVETSLTLRNNGTRRLDNIRVTAQCPGDWRSEITPDLIHSLESGSESIAAVKIIPPPDVSTGDYEIRIRTESFADNRRIQTDDKVYRISIKHRASLLSTGALVGGLLVIVLGVVVFGVKLTKR